SARVESKSMDALSASEDLYRAEKRTTTVASGKLQQTNVSRANGLTTCMRRRSANKTADCTVTRPRLPIHTMRERASAWAAKMRPTANTATPEVAEPISSKQLATTAGKRTPARTSVMRRIDAQSSADFRPALRPVRIGFCFAELEATSWRFDAASISKRI